MERLPTTAWGAPLDDLRRAAASLRALATRHGVDLEPVDTVATVELSAAVVGAELLCRAVGASSLEELSAPCHRADRAVSRLLLRASGLVGGHARPDLLQVATVPLGLAGDVDRMLDWASRWATTDEVAARVCADLSASRNRAAVALAFCLHTLA